MHDFEIGKTAYPVKPRGKYHTINSAITATPSVT